MLGGVVPFQIRRSDYCRQATVTLPADIDEAENQ